MRKKVLVAYFTQSGQLGEIIDNLTKPLMASDIGVEKIQIFPVKKFPFPWTYSTFFNTMPESVQCTATKLEPFYFNENKYDLIIIGVQPWFLSPSIPISSFLQHPSFKQIAGNTPVVTISGCRNMWISAQEKSKRLLKQAGAQLVGNMALIDTHNNYISLVTILHWMFTGKKDKKWSIFPKPGVSSADITRTSEFGNTLKRHLLSGDWKNLQPTLLAQRAINIKYSLMFIERKASRIFYIWANIIVKKKKRSSWLVAFKYYLLIALCVAAPIILLIDTILFRPFLSARIAKQKKYYSGVELI